MCNRMAPNLLPLDGKQGWPGGTDYTLDNRFAG